MKTADAGFYASVRDARRILVVLFGGLGDIVHSVPVLRSMRRSFPEARIDTIVADVWSPLVASVEGIDRVLPQAQFKAGWSWANLRQFLALFASRYDLCVNLWGSNHASVTALATLARVRLVRRPLETWKKGWQLCHTHVGVYPQLEEPMHQQWTALLERLGFAVVPGLSLRVDAERLLPRQVEPALRGRYIHFSPSASEAAKELALEPTIRVLRVLGEVLPGIPVVMSTTAAPRHRERLAAILRGLPQAPRLVFEGGLDAAQLFALIQESALHVSADSGPLHMAVAAGVPSVSFFQVNPYLREYLPPAPRHHAFVSQAPRGDGIRDLIPEDIVGRCAALIALPAGAASG